MMQITFAFLQCGFLAAFTVRYIRITNNTVPVMGSELQLRCSIDNFTSAVSVSVNSEPILAPASLVFCNSQLCLGYVSGLIFSPDENGISITIQQLNRTRDQKYWFCGSSYVHVVVFTPPKHLYITTTPASNLDLVKSDAVLTCSSDCVYPAPYFQWFYKTDDSGGWLEWTEVSIMNSEANICTEGERVYNSVLTVPKYRSLPGSEDYNALFRCGILNLTGMSTTLYSSATANISFAVSATKPTLTNGTSDTIVLLAGKPTTLQCVSSLTRPPVSVVWRLNHTQILPMHNTNLSETEKLFTVESVATFTPDKNDDGKVVTCETFITGQESRPQAVKAIRVQYPPVISLTLSGTPEENRGLIVRCLADGNPAHYVYANMTQTWNGNFIGTFNIQENGEVILQSPAVEDSGNYTCFANNGIRDINGILTQTGTKEVLIQGKPKIIVDASQLFAEDIDKSISIIVPVYSHPNLTKVIFRNQNGTNIGMSDKYKVSFEPKILTDVFHNKTVEVRGYIAVMHIPRVEESDFGNYTVDIENDLGTTHWRIGFLKRGIPDPPLGLIFLGFDDDVPRFLFEAGFNGGYPQTFIIDVQDTETKRWERILSISEDDTIYRLPNKSYVFRLPFLSPDTYVVRVIAENDRGRQEKNSATVELTIRKKVPEAQNSFPAATVGGSVGATAATAAAVVIIILIVRKRKTENETKTTATDTLGVRAVDEYMQLDHTNEYRNVALEYDELDLKSGRHEASI